MPNLSQLKRERMLAFLQKIKDEHRDDDDMLIALGEIESELTSKKYGLVWEQHEEAVDVMMRDNVPVFTEVPEREITAAPGQGYNFILEGDNLHSLRLLEKTHKGKIDIIYIDPPYNRGGNDFRYEDTFVEKQDGFRHSKWLSFMESRLRIAWQLLKSDGVIFISIDDFEMGALRMLCDDVFGEAFFLCNIVWQKRYSRENREAIGDAHEYILVYAKDMDRIIRYAETNDIPIATFSRANGELRKEFEKFNNSSKLALLDLTSVSYAIEDNKALIYALEQFLSIMPNIRVIAQTAQIDVLLKYFPLFLDGQEPVCKLLPDLSGLGEKEPEESELAKVTDLSGESFETFIDAFDHNLIGHRYFKDRLRYSLKNFISLNKAKEQKVLSIFLFGASGIGKTEVARLIANGLQNDCYLAKINFQNYSSQDALNSLIGSPAGYVGCNHGELSEKIQKSKVGVLLCDEFEKTTRPVFSFFLELLEEGRFTDSMAREYDMDGYVIIFTSNLLSEAEYKKVIPPELQTRFDLVCEFEEPTTAEKTAFLDLLLEMAKTKYSEQFAKIEITEDDKKRLYAFDYSSLSALRDIKRVFNNRLMDYFVEKGVL